VSTATGALESKRAPAALREWAALGTVYLVWGSTYLAIRVMVKTVPPLLGAGARFLLAGALMLVLLRAAGRTIRVSRRQFAGAGLLGVLLPGANAVVSVAEVHVPSNLAALLIAAVPLILIVLRAATGERVARASYAGVVIGFAGVALLLLAGHRPDGATIGGLLLLIGAATMWATGSLAGSRIDLPGDVLVSTAWQMLLGGAIILAAGLLAREHVGHVSGDSAWGFAFLVVIGSMVAYTAYAWLLRNVRVSKVATYAYVNPAVAIVLGWLILGETITVVTLIGAAVIIASVALVVRAEASR
jgi:drug/metabolite transporter (DMT)-like permease